MKHDFIPGTPMPRLQRWLPVAVRRFYFDAVTLHTPDGRRAQPLTTDVPVILLVSHRNGAMDGYTVQKLHPAAVSMVSVQLTANPLIRLFFSGIPVVREKDRERYGKQAARLANPVMIAIRHVEAGGSLCVYPEGSSEWAHTHLPYQPGGAKIIRHLLQKSVQFEVRVVGLFYTAPDVFRSRADVIVSGPLAITARQPDENVKNWEARIFAQTSSALETISVNCRNAAHFGAVAQYARACNRQTGVSYGATFIAAQQQPEAPAAPACAPRPYSGARGCLGALRDFVAVAVMLLMLLPVMLAGHLGGRLADGTNTVMFFRVLAAAPVLLLWLLAQLALAVIAPLALAVLLPLWGIALFGLTRYARVRACLMRKDAW